LVVERADGSLLAWLANDGLESPPPGVQVEPADDPCSYDTECGTVELDGLQGDLLSERVRVPYGASVDVGDYRVQGGYQRLTESRCTWASSGTSTIAIYATTRMPAASDAGGS
jgi:hypothetical protein